MYLLRGFFSVYHAKVVSSWFAVNATSELLKQIQVNGNSVVG